MIMTETLHTLYFQFILEMAATVSVLASYRQRYTYRVLQTIQMKLILLCVWAEWAVLGSAKTALKFMHEI